MEGSEQVWKTSTNKDGCCIRKDKGVGSLVSLNIPIVSALKPRACSLWVEILALTVPIMTEYKPLELELRLPVNVA